MKTRLVIIGGVAGGATAAARARRISEEAEITVLERGPYVSYANCGLPYFISRDIDRRSRLLLQTPEGFEKRYRVTVRVRTEAVEIDRTGKRVRTRGPEGEGWVPYDQLVMAQGGNPVLPDLPGSDAPHVFRLWTVPDMDRLDGFIERERPRIAVVVGGGFIGLEMAEAFRKRGLETTVVELLPSVMSTMDAEFGALVAKELERNGVRVLTRAGVKAVDPAGKAVELSDGRRVAADLVLFSVGVRPELTLARSAGLEIGPSGGLVVDEYLRTSDPAIHAAGDMVEVVHKVSGRRVRIPLAGPANRQGRIAASNALGLRMRYSGALGTSVVKVFEATAAMTGLTERAAREAGFTVGVAVVHKDHHAGYYPGAKELALKLVYDRKTARLLGAQAFGPAGADKRIDVLATALQGKMTLHELVELDLAYAPPYSSANDPVNVAAFAALNDVTGFAPLATAAELKAALASPAPPLLLDVRTAKEFAKSHVRGAVLVPIDDLRSFLLGGQAPPAPPVAPGQAHSPDPALGRGSPSLPRDRRVYVVCLSGYRAHLAVRILKERGFEDVVNVAGGHLSVLAEGGFDLEEA